MLRTHEPEYNHAYCVATITSSAVLDSTGVCDEWKWGRRGHGQRTTCLTWSRHSTNQRRAGRRIICCAAQQGPRLCVEEYRPAGDIDVRRVSYKGPRVRDQRIAQQIAESHCAISGVRDVAESFPLLGRLSGCMSCPSSITSPAALNRRLVERRRFRTHYFAYASQEIL
jgi:hypothetical protein